jgi:hypothetical protein
MRDDAMSRAQGWGVDSARTASALSGSSWANAAAGTPDGAGADSAAAAASRHTSSAKKPGKQRKGGLSMFLSGEALIAAIWLLTGTIL